MLLNNFRRVLVNSIVSYANISNTKAMNGEIKTTAGNVYNPQNIFYLQGPTVRGLGSDCDICTIDTDYNSVKVSPSSFEFTGCQIYLGTGNTTPTTDDYKLSGDLITGLTSQAQDGTATNNSITYSAIATNNTESPVTIKEIGLGGYAIGSYACAVLLTRDVLATPVTLNVGDSKTFSITIDFRSLTDTTVNE